MLCHVSLNNKSFTWCTEFYYRDNSPITSYNLKTQLLWASPHSFGKDKIFTATRKTYNLWSIWSLSWFQRKKGKYPCLFFCSLLPRNYTKYHAVVLLLMVLGFFTGWCFFFWLVGFCLVCLVFGFCYCCCFWLFDPQKLIWRHAPVIPTNSWCDKSNTISTFAFWSI